VPGQCNLVTNTTASSEYESGSKRAPILASLSKSTGKRGQREEERQRIKGGAAVAEGELTLDYKTNPINFAYRKARKSKGTGKAIAQSCVREKVESNLT